MISARLFLAGMYLHLGLSILVPVVILTAGEWNNFGTGLFFAYLGFILVLFVIGWLTVAMAAVEKGRGNFPKLAKGWRLLKLGSIPFFAVNFVYSFLVWFVITAASRGILGLLVPIPILLTCTLILQTGCVGCIALRSLYDQPGLDRQPSTVHYLLQLLPVLDVVSTLLLLPLMKQGERREPPRPDKGR